ncbi:MAG: hypothetical protein K2X81_28930 [Candidatus Obscuribacterales bacterium]|nr:hypothetical protein [Candidatus Obscuribacterales bacterium]
MNFQFIYAASLSIVRSVQKGLKVPFLLFLLASIPISLGSCESNSVRVELLDAQGQEFAWNASSDRLSAAMRVVVDGIPFDTPYAKTEEVLKVLKPVMLDAFKILIPHEGKSFTLLEWSATSLSTGEIFICGGALSAEGENNTAATDHTWIFDAKTGQLRAGPDMKVARCAPTLTHLKTGKILISGGCSSLSKNPIEEVCLYDCKTNSITSVGSMQIARVLHEAVELPNGQIVILGGESKSQAGEDAGVVELIDLCGVQCITKAKLDVCRTTPIVICVENRIVVVGGWSLSPEDEHMWVKQVESFDFDKLTCE